MSYVHPEAEEEVAAMLAFRAHIRTELAAGRFTLQRCSGCGGESKFVGECCTFCATDCSAADEARSIRESWTEYGDYEGPHFADTMSGGVIYLGG